MRKKGSNRRFKRLKYFRRLKECFYSVLYDYRVKVPILGTNVKIQLSINVNKNH